MKCSKCGSLPKESDQFAWRCNSCKKVYRVSLKNIQGFVEKKKGGITEPLLKCKECGAPLDDGNETIAWKCTCDEITVAENAPDIIHPNLIRCPDCGAKIFPNVKYCPECGCSIGSKESFGRKRSKRAMVVCGIIGAACVLLVVGIMLHKKFNKVEMSNEEVLESEAVINDTNDDKISTAQAETNDLEDENIIEPGMYRVGKDISAGEYIIFASTTERPGYYCVSSDSNGDDIITNENFDYNAILTVCDSEYLDLSNSYAVPFDDVDELDTTGYTGMFKVGVHINSGEYELTSMENEDGYYCIYSDSRCEEIESNGIFEKNRYIIVENGQYLKLDGCKLSKLIEEDPEENGEGNGELGCPFSTKQFEKVYTSKLDSSKYQFDSRYFNSYHFWELYVIGEDASIVIEDLEREDSVANVASFYIKYGLDEHSFRDIVGAFIETMFSNITQEERDALDSTFNNFVNNYINESGSYSGIRGDGKINIVMSTMKEYIGHGVIISALKSE